MPVLHFFSEALFTYFQDVYQ